MKHFILVCLLFTAGFINTSSAQQFEPGRKMDSTELANMRQRLEQANLNNVGRKFPSFDAITTEGKFLNADSLKGKVTLLVFWYPSCNCFDLKKLNELNDHFKSNPAFRLAVVTNEITGLNDYIQKEKISFPLAIVSSTYELQEMRFHNGSPTFVVVNKFGIVSSVKSTFQPFKTKDFTDLLAGLLQ